MFFFKVDINVRQYEQITRKIPTLSLLIKRHPATSFLFLLWSNILTVCVLTLNIQWYWRNFSCISSHALPLQHPSYSYGLLTSIDIVSKNLQKQAHILCSPGSIVLAESENGPAKPRVSQNGDAISEAWRIAPELLLLYARPSMQRRRCRIGS